MLIECIQSILRKHKYENAYEKCKEFSRKTDLINIIDLEGFILNLDIKEEIKKEINDALNIYKYVGNARNVD